MPQDRGDVVPLFTVLHTNHFVMIGRCFHACTPTTTQNQELGIATPDGRLSLDLLKTIDKAFYNYLMEGHRVVRLKPGIHDHPDLVRAVIASCNHDLAMGETEAQLLVTAKELISNGVSVKTATMDLKVQFPHLQHHCESIAFLWRSSGATTKPPSSKILSRFTPKT